MVTLYTIGCGIISERTTGLTDGVNFWVEQGRLGLESSMEIFGMPGILLPQSELDLHTRCENQVKMKSIARQSGMATRWQ